MKGRLLTLFGLILILLGISVLLFSYGPIAYQEIAYWWRTQQFSTTVSTTDQPTLLDSENPTIISPIDTNFGIVIPKIAANAPVVANVDPYDSAIYQKQLAKGVAHAQGTGLPDENKTMFLFAHSSGDILMAQRYNSVFYLLNKLTQGDPIDIYYQDQPYHYQVTTVKTVAPDSIDYLANVPDSDLILMTCTPPGTTWKRLLVMATKSEPQSPQEVE